MGGAKEDEALQDAEDDMGGAKENEALQDAEDDMGGAKENAALQDAEDDMGLEPLFEAMERPEAAEPAAAIAPVAVPKAPAAAITPVAVPKAPSKPQVSQVVDVETEQTTAGPSKIKKLQKCLGLQTVPTHDPDRAEKLRQMLAQVKTLSCMHAYMIRARVNQQRTM